VRGRAALRSWRFTTAAKANEVSMNDAEKCGAMIGPSPGIVYVLDPEGQFIFVGRALETLTGYSPEDLMGKHFSSLICPNDVEDASRHFHERRTGNRATRRRQVRLRTKNTNDDDPGSRYRTVELDAFGIWDKPPSHKDKKFCGTYGVVRDIAGPVSVEEKMGDQRKATSAMLIDLIEAERERIALDLHDHVGQSLVSLKMDLEAMSGEEIAIAEKLKKGIKAAEQEVAHIIEKLRKPFPM
jgi:signal transduction histidine kinase